MNLVDLVAVGALVVAALVGYRVGATRQLLGLAGGLLALICAVALAVTFSARLLPMDPVVRGFVLIAMFTVSFIVGQRVGVVAAERLVPRESDGIAARSNRVLGSAVGALQALLLLWLLAGLVAAGSNARWAAQVETSATVRGLSTVAPPPQTVTDDLRSSWSSSSLGGLFEGFEWGAAGPSDLPSGPRARRIATAAQDSVVKVLATGCAQASQGSGAVVDQGYVVTNAHVVNGSSDVLVEHAGSRYDAAVVGFDASLDIALLWVPQLAAPALDFATEDPGRGVVGVAMGFPGDRALTAVRASVNRMLPVFGQVGRGEFTRDVLELHARVSPGDSGGPFVLADGTIGGIVFAESPSDPRVGYALAASQVSERVSQYSGRQSAVSTGSCR